MNETKLTGESLDIISDNVSKLKEIFPDVITEDKIDFEKLELILGKDIDTSSERYNFTWPSKTLAIKESQKQSTGTLRPCKEESKDWDTTKNLYIEGDNLEVLKLLQKGYYNKVKMIYIDPPYNTGNDFVYKDDYKDNLTNYFEISGQTESGDKLTTNTESDGRFHSNWLNMMYPRLKLARNLLSDDGVIFISIDDTEEENLKRVCKEIFGESNFVTTLIWRRRKTQANLAKNFAPVHDYILVFAKNLDNLDLNKVPYSEEFIKKTFKNPDNDPRGPYQTGPLARPANSSNKEYELVMPNGRKITAKWSCSQETFNKYVEENRLVIPREGKGMPRIKIFLNELEGQIPNTWLDNIATNDEASKEIEKFFGSNAFFSFPKPSNLIKHLMNIGLKEDNIILDFFSGSATTAHSLFKFNNENNSKCRFILVQLDEPINQKSVPYKAGFKYITEIGKERIRKAGKEIVEESGNKNLDIGFKVFKLDSSNLEKWDPDYEDLEQTLLVAKDNIKEDRTQEDLIYEIMLKYGIDLTLPIEEYKTSSNTIYSIGFGALLICLDDEITTDITNDIIDLASEDVSRVVFKDNGFASDADKTNIKETLRTHHIDEFITI